MPMPFLCLNLERQQPKWSNSNSADVLDFQGFRQVLLVRVRPEIALINTIAHTRRNTQDMLVEVNKLRELSGNEAGVDQHRLGSAGSLGVPSIRPTYHNGKQPCQRQRAKRFHSSQPLSDCPSSLSVTSFIRVSLKKSDICSAHCADWNRAVGGQPESRWT